MERILTVYMLVIAITFALVLIALRGDESLFQKFAKVRVRVDENRGREIQNRPQLQEPQEEEVNIGRALALMFFGVLMLVLMLLNNI